MHPLRLANRSRNRAQFSVQGDADRLRDAKDIDKTRTNSWFSFVNDLKPIVNLLVNLTDPNPVVNLACFAEESEARRRVVNYFEVRASSLVLDSV